MRDAIFTIDMNDILSLLKYRSLVRSFVSNVPLNYSVFIFYIRTERYTRFEFFFSLYSVLIWVEVCFGILMNKTAINVVCMRFPSRDKCAWLRARYEWFGFRGN